MCLALTFGRRSFPRNSSENTQTLPASSVKKVLQRYSYRRRTQRAFQLLFFADLSLLSWPRPPIICKLFAGIISDQSKLLPSCSRHCITSDLPCRADDCQTNAVLPLQRFLADLKVFLVVYCLSLRLDKQAPQQSGEEQLSMNRACSSLTRHSPASRSIASVSRSQSSSPKVSATV